MKNEELKQEYVDERTGITYTLKGDYYIPNIAIPKARRMCRKISIIFKILMKNKK